MKEKRVPLCDKNEKELIWKVYQEIGQFERHFNTIQSRYRTIASTWILGTFAAIGYTWSVWDDAMVGSQDKYLIIALLGICACIGLALIMILDLLIYHRLLETAFEEGKCWENRHKWLPAIRINMAEANENRSVSDKTKIFYFVSMAILGLFSWIAITVWIKKGATEISYIKQLKPKKECDEQNNNMY